MRQAQLTSQRLGLQQRQMQAMTLLAMTSTEIDAYLDEAALENPVIEVVRCAVEVDVPMTGIRSGDLALNWEDVSIVDEGAWDIETYLLSQVKSERLSCEQLRVLRYLIGMIDESGYLTQSVEQAARCAQADRTVVSAMVEVLHGLEPRGIGARTVRESLLLQLDALDADTELAEAIVRDRISLLAKNRVSDLERAYPDAKHEEVLEAVRTIRGLDPRPGSIFAVERTQYVVADIVVEDADEGFEVRLGPAGGQDIRLDGSCRAVVSKEDDPNARTWLEAKYRQAYALRSCLKQRRELMLSIAVQLANRQKAFFSFGPRYLTEVTMSQVAEDLSLSVSTVSRAAKGAYVQCRWGVFPMKALFSHSSIARFSGSGDPRLMLRDIIAVENPVEPLSDQKIVEEFARQGVKLSRRTVARYRQELGIRSASERRYR